MKDNNIHIGVNAPFDLKQFNKNSSSEYQKQLKAVYKTKSRLSFSEIANSEEYDVISIGSKRALRDADDNGLVYEVIKTMRTDDEGKTSECYEMNTGIFVGCLVVDKCRIVINSGYDDVDNNDSFFRLLLKQSNNIYVDSDAKYNDSSNGYDVFNVLEYLFLSTLKNAINFGIPRRYVEKKAKGWNVKGKIDINKYFSGDIYKKDGISYRYRELAYDSDILNVLFYALSLCDKKYVNDAFKEVTSFANQIKGDISLKKPNEQMLNRCLKSPVLFNGLYSKYRKALIYAEMIIKHNNLTPEAAEGKKAVGWIIDISELWEEYVYNLLKDRFSDWNVSPQETLDLYNGTFYRRNNYPDIIMERNGHLMILDAKFKKMDFESKDVDRADLHQVQSYFGYYSALNKYIIDAVMLVYPAREEPPEKRHTSTSMFGIDSCKTIFDIAYVKVGKDNAEQQRNEEEFIARMERVIQQS